jgi:hypothetical protein
MTLQTGDFISLPTERGVREFHVCPVVDVVKRDLKPGFWFHSITFGCASTSLGTQGQIGKTRIEQRRRFPRQRESAAVIWMPFMV